MFISFFIILLLLLEVLFIALSLSTSLGSFFASTFSRFTIDVSLHRVSINIPNAYVGVIAEYLSRLFQTPNQTHTKTAIDKINTLFNVIIIVVSAWKQHNHHYYNFPS